MEALTGFCAVSLLPIPKIVKEIYDPYQEDRWWGTIRIEDVNAALNNRRFEYRAFTVVEEQVWRDGLEYDHVARIAFLVENVSDEPIFIEITSVGGDAKMRDGCHRLAAALYRGDKTIQVRYEGFVEGFNNWVSRDKEGLL